VGNFVASLNSRRITCVFDRIVSEAEFDRRTVEPRAKMTREDGERRVWDWWSRATQAGTSCEMRIEPSLTEEYEWGWVVAIGPARRAELRRPYLYERS
jgi:hypothetical protein